MNSGSRRNFLKNISKSAFSLYLGTKIFYADAMPRGYIPLFWEEEGLKELGKHPELRILNNHPWNIETPPHLLQDRITPADKHFVRNNGLMPEAIDANSWKLEIEGAAVGKPSTFTLKELQEKFPVYSYHITLECAGNGRKEFHPSTSGNQWSTGAVACSKWTGIRLKDLFALCELKSNAVYIGYYGADRHLSGDPSKASISRGVPIHKAIEDQTLLAWNMNDQPIPKANGYPLRLVVGGWPASVSGKWLKKIVVRDRIHDGEKMEGKSYRLPCEPVEPGAEVADKDMCIIESMPVKSLITFPKSGALINENNELKLGGHAWAGDRSVSKMETSIDFGQTWQKADLKSPINRFAWQQWSQSIRFPGKGYFEVWARATDSEGSSQPMISPGWNPRGYCNNATHRIAIKIG